MQGMTVQCSPSLNMCGHFKFLGVNPSPYQISILVCQVLVQILASLFQQTSFRQVPVPDQSLVTPEKSLHLLVSGCDVVLRGRESLTLNSRGPSHQWNWVIQIFMLLDNLSASAAGIVNESCVNIYFFGQEWSPQKYGYQVLHQYLDNWYVLT